MENLIGKHIYGSFPTFQLNDLVDLRTFDPRFLPIEYHCVQIFHIQHLPNHSGAIVNHSFIVPIRALTRL